MDALPPDPYAALGVAKDATAAVIKAQYRKLVLKHHPDKVQDEAQKQSASDQFHKVQTAYEIVGDDARRQRYDAQCRLVELRKDIEREYAEARVHGDVRPGGYRGSPDSPRAADGYFTSRSGRMSPQYEERRPAYADYYEPPRPTSRRKESSHDRSSKRAPPREEPKKSKSSSKTASKKPKETERSSRAEKAKRADQDVRRERESKKATYVSVEEEPSSDSDAYERSQRRMREEDEKRRAKAAMEEARRLDEEEAAARFFGSERARNMWDVEYKAKENQAREYIANRNIPPFERRSSAQVVSPVQDREAYERRPSAPVGTTSFQDREAAERRPSAPVYSSRDNVETIKRDGRPSIEVRRGSGRPVPVSRDSGRKKSSREKEIHLVDDPEDQPRRAPTLNKTNSSPENIRPPFERQRSNSMSGERREVPQPTFRRAETMPYPNTRGETRRKESGARNPYPSPDATPEPPSSRKQSYGFMGDEVTSPETYQPEYQTVTREPGPKQRLTRSPSPIRETRKESRGSTSRHAATQPPLPRRSTSHQYSYPDGAFPTVESFPRPSMSRENSGRLFAEISTTQSPRPGSNKMFSPPPDEVRYSPKLRPQDIKTATGNYTVRRSSERPYTRNGSISVK